MKVVILTIGGWGDTLPFIALGKGLQSAGHDVKVAAVPDFSALVKEHGLDYAPVNVDIRALLSGDLGQAIMKNYNIVKGIRFFVKTGSEMIAQAFEDFWLASQGTDAVLYGTAAFIGSALGEEMRVPAMALDLYPIYPTKEFPNFAMGLPDLGSYLNRFTYHAWEMLMWLMFTGPLNRLYREKLDLPRAPFGGIVRQARLKKTPVLSGYSPTVLPQPTDWPSHVRATGYWFLDAPAGWTPPKDLVRFLQSGPPPIYIGFGSMANKNAQQISAQVLEALEKTGQRGILFRGWGGLSPVDVPDTVCLIDPVPHSWLFPQVAAVVHHGGVGTTAAGLRAGVPSIIVPHIVDQFFWGKHVAKLGVGVDPIPRKNFSSEKLAAAVERAVSDTALQQRARDLGKKIRAEDGIQRAVELFEQWVGRLAEN